MVGFLSRIFGGKSASAEKRVENLIGDVLQGIIDRGKLELSFDVKKMDSEEKTEEVISKYIVELYGQDEELLMDKEGSLLDAFQLYMKRVVQHHFPETEIDVVFDCNGFRDESNKALVELADRLKSIALQKRKSVYFRALPPKDRKVIHQYLAEDGRVKSRSIGDGVYKKIKIYPVKSQG